jgi:uncharacterized membrane protein
MKKSTMNVIVVILGTAVSFLLIRFLTFGNSTGPYFAGWILTYSIIAIVSIIFGGFVGGAIGLLGNTLSIISRSFNPIDIFTIIAIGLYGLLVGISCGKNVERSTEKNIMKNVGLVFLLSMIFRIAGQFIWLIGFFLVNIIRYRDISRAVEIIGRVFITSIEQGFAIGIISSVSILVYLKWRKNKGLLQDEESKIPEQKIVVSQEQMLHDSKFDGGLLSYIGWNILGFLVTVLTLGICYPWALCMVYGWRINHTIINGKRLKFKGKSLDLFLHWLLWLLLCIITLGIYSFWLSISLERWKVKNTIFEETI